MLENNKVVTKRLLIQVNLSIIELIIATEKFHAQLKLHAKKRKKQGIKLKLFT
jgi:hypothetical protein